MKLTVQWLVPLCLAARVAEAYAEDFFIACPPTFVTQAVNFAPAALPAGWAPFMPGLLYVNNAAILYGPPNSFKYSLPSSFTDGLRFDTITWEWDLPDGEKWLSCGYGAGDALTLSAPLPPDVTKCTAKLQKEEGGNVSAVSLQCAHRIQVKPDRRR